MLVFMLVFSLFLAGSSFALECGDCFTDIAPYVQVNYQPVINWGDENVNVCPGTQVNYNPGDPLYLVFGWWDSCEKRRGEPQKICGELYVVVADETLSHFLFYDTQGWHYTTNYEEIKPYRAIQPEGEPPLVLHFYFPEGVLLPSGKYYVISFVDKIADGKPSLGSENDYKYCRLEINIP